MKLIGGGKSWSDDDDDDDSLEFPIAKIERKNSDTGVKCRVIIVETYSHWIHLCQDDNDESLYIVEKVEKLQFSASKWEKAKQFVKEHPVKPAVIGLPLAVAGAGAAATAAGFGGAGIVGGSVAAGVQSGIGNVAAGSMFAWLQSLGATGTFTAMTAGGLAASAGGAAVAVATTKKHDGDTEDENNNDKDTGSEDESTSDDPRSIVADMQELVGAKAKIVDSNKLLIFPSN